MRAYRFCFRAGPWQGKSTCPQGWWYQIVTRGLSRLARRLTARLSGSENGWGPG